MNAVADQLGAIAPAVAFLLAGVPLAALLDHLGFFDAVVTMVAGWRAGATPVLALWIVAAATTAVLNLDTTVVLLTPLYLRIARRAGTDPLPLLAIPLLLACLASSLLPVSNLTTLIAVEHWELTVGDVVTHLALPSLAAVVVGWLAYRRRYPTTIAMTGGAPPDRRALGIGTAVVAGLLLGFVVGPAFGIDPWVVALVADLVLIAVTRTVPWRQVPLLTGLAVLGLAVAALLVPIGPLTDLLGHDEPLAVLAITLVAAVTANVVNNLPALLLAVDATDTASWGAWAWLLGVNTAAVLLPLGALANVLWWRIARDEGVPVSLRSYAGVTIPIAGPAFLAAALVLVVERVIAG